MMKAERLIVPNGKKRGKRLNVAAQTIKDERKILE